MPSDLKIASVIIKTSVQNLGLAVDKEIYAVVKANNVTVTVDG